MSDWSALFVGGVAGLQHLLRVELISVNNNMKMKLVFIISKELELVCIIICGSENLVYIAWGRKVGLHHIGKAANTHICGDDYFQTHF